MFIILKCLIFTILIVPYNNFVRTILASMFYISGQDFTSRNVVFQISFNFFKYELSIEV